MGFVRAWSAPVFLGLAIAFLGIGVAEVSGMPARRAQVGAGPPSQPPSRPPSVAPAAIEQYENGSQPVQPQPVIQARPSSKTPARPESDARSKPSSPPTPAPRPRPSASVAAKPRPTPTPVLTPVLTPVAAPTLSPSPSARPSPTSPPSAARPADVLDLRRWKLTLPAGRRHDPAEIRQPQLGRAGNGSFFRVRPDRGVTFRTPVGGVTTENSKYPRAELREMTADGRREAAWSSTSGRHVMTITQVITATPRAKPHVVAGQIHDAEDDVVMIRLEGRRLFVESGGDEVGVLDPRYRLGRRFTVSVVATPSGVRITYTRPSRGSRVVTVRKVGDGWYFKAGCYVQSNPDRGDRPSAYGEVVIYGLTVRHTAA